MHAWQHVLAILLWLVELIECMECIDPFEMMYNNNICEPDQDEEENDDNNDVMKIDKEVRDKYTKGIFRIEQVYLIFGIAIVTYFAFQN